MCGVCAGEGVGGDWHAWFMEGGYSKGRSLEEGAFYLSLSLSLCVRVDVTYAY